MTGDQGIGSVFVPEVVGTEIASQEDAERAFDAVVVLDGTGEGSWGWDMFRADQRCYRLSVINGVARVYSMTVGIDW